MGILTKGIKKAIESQTPKTKPKKEISPLVKQTEDMLVTQDQIPEQTDYFGRKTDDYEEVIGRLYSPVYSAIENMPIGKGGTKGENINAYLQKRAPNVDKAELQSFNINLDPKRLYTKEEVLNLAKQEGSSDYTIEKQKYTEYEDTQRQLVMDAEEDYVELTVEGKQEYTVAPSSIHLGRKSNLGHTRSSIRREAPTRIQQKIVDRPRYLLIEEIQSDLAKDRGKDGYLKEDFFESDEGNYDLQLETPFNNMSITEEDFNVDLSFKLRDPVQKFVYEKFSPYNVNNVDDVKKINEDETYVGLLKDEVKKITGKEPVGDTVIKVAKNAFVDNTDFARVERAAYLDPNIKYESSDLQELYSDEIDEEFDSILKNLNELYSRKKSTPDDVKKLPVASRSDYVKRLLLANIAYAKRNGIDKIVIPSPAEIAKERVDSFDVVLANDEQLFEVYEKASKKKGFDKNKFATDHYEKIFKPLYKDAVTKVLNSLKSETKGKIKYGTKELKYRGPYKEDAQGRLTNTRTPYKANAIEIDITDFEFNPEAQGLRFNEGGAVPMQEQMKVFNEGGLKDEGGSVDPISGNDVPIGSTQEEVRDDVPAMLSEGEFVFPADVVRYVGLSTLMQLRQDAKMGLKQMEAMGQMGNSEEATLPDDMPFDMADLVIVEGTDEPKEMAQGGVIQAQTGTFVTPTFDPEDKDMRPYTNDGGKTVRYIPFLNNSPVYPIPSGYVPLDQATAAPEETPEEVAPEQGGGGGGGSRPPEPSEFQKAGGWDMDFGDPPDPKKVELWVKESEKISTVGNIATGILTAINPAAGLLTHIGTKANKKGILDNAQTVLALASEDQKERIDNVTKRLTDPERKGILSKILGGVVDEIGDALGLSKQEQGVAKTTSTAGVNTITTETNKQSEENINAAIKAAETVQIRDPEEDTFLFPSTVRDEAPLSFNEPLISDRAGIQTGKIFTPYSDRAGTQTGDQPELISTTDRMLKGDSGTPITSDSMLKGESGTPTTSDYMLKGDAGTATTTDQMLKGDSGSLTYLVDAFRRNSDPIDTGSAQLYTDVQSSRASEMYQNLTDGLFSTFESQNKYANPMGDNEFKASTSISDLGTGELPKASDIESYLSSVSDDNDKPKKDRSAKDRRDRRQNQKRFKDAATKARMDNAIRGGGLKVFEDAYDSGASAERLKSIGKEDKKITEKLKDMEKGIITGFAKGGLASRKKK